MPINTLGDYSMEDTKGKAEVVDDESGIESDYVNDIKETLKDTDDSLNELCETCLEQLSKQQFINYLSVKFFPDNKAMKYSEITGSNNKKFVDFCMKAALKFLVSDDTNDKVTYDENTGLLSQGGKTAEEILKARGGIDNDSDGIDPVIVRILQNKVTATVDGKPGPQTILLTISALGGDVSNIYEGVNTLYSNNDKFRIQNIAEFTISDVNYKYDKNQFSIGQEGDLIKITYNNEIKEVDKSKNPPECDGFTFENGWIKLNKSVSDGLPDQLSPVEKLENDEKENLINMFKTFKEDYNSNNKLRFVVRESDGSIKKYGNSSSWKVFSVSDNGYIGYYSHTPGGNVSYSGGNESYDSGGLYSLVRAELDCGNYSSLFSKGYDLLQTDEAKNLLKKENKTSTDFYNLGQLFNDSWDGESHLQKLGSWLCSDKSNGAGACGQDFLRWCDAMDKKGVSRKKLTIGNRLAMSKIKCSPDDIIEQGSFLNMMNN